MVEFRMPQFGMGMTDGTITVWHHAEGDAITMGEPLLEIEAAKTTVEVPAPASGILSRILVKADQNVPVHTPIAIIEDGLATTPLPTAIAGQREDAHSPLTLPNSSSQRASPLARRTAERAGVDLVGVVGSGVGGKVVAADVMRAAAERNVLKVQIEPRARRAAKELGIDLTLVTGSGPNGRIIEEDVRTWKAPSTEPMAPSAIASPVGGRAVKHTGMRRTIASRLTESKQSVPHFYLKASCEVDLLLALRRQINAGYPEAKVSLNDFVVRAVALALRRVPEANVSWTEQAMLHFDQIDLSVAVATPRGLVTPVVRAVDAKPIVALAGEIRALAARGREGKLRPDEYEGGSATISNLGMYGTEEFAAIINPPQASILAIGAAEKRAIVRDDLVVPATIMTVTLSVDHRAIDGAVAAELLKAFRLLIEQPALILA